MPHWVDLWWWMFLIHVQETHPWIYWLWIAAVETVPFSVLGISIAKHNVCYRFIGSAVCIILISYYVIGDWLYMIAKTTFIMCVTLLV